MTEQDLLELEQLSETGLRANINQQSPLLWKFALLILLLILSEAQ
jgi:hypothetical protein